MNPLQETAAMLLMRRQLLGLVISLLAIRGIAAAEIRVLPDGQTPRDARLEKLRDQDSGFPFTPSKSKEDWQRRAEHIRRQILVSAGLWPMPEKTPDHQVIHGKVDRDGYTVEKVYFESYPGHFVTGSLYRPKGRSGKLPAVLAPHGHWANGRFFDAGPEEIQNEIKSGAERFEIGGRYPLQAICVQLARMGCVVFQYDTLGVADSVQIPHSPKWNPKADSADRWGMASPQAEVRLQSNFGLQTYNSLRALDFLCGLPDVDASRIGMTGASGGGTQTFILSAIDPRPAVAFPAVMVSTAMQGGCNCENAPYLRIGQGNVDIAATFAPKPLGMTSANDWTKEFETKGFPELKRIYQLYDSPDNVMLKPLTQFGHNYNYVSRAAVYSWFNEHFNLGLKDPIVAEDFKPLTIPELTVWDDNHPAPPKDYEHQQAFLRDWADTMQKQIDLLAPKDEASLKEYRRVVGGAVEVMIGRGVPENGKVTFDIPNKEELDAFDIHKLMIRYPEKREEFPVIILMPEHVAGNRVVIWVDPQGKQALFGKDGKPRPGVQKLLDAGCPVVGVDLFGQGEFTPDGKPLAKAKLLENAYAGFTFCYNPSMFSQRVRDLLSLVSYARSTSSENMKIGMIGLGGGGHWVAAARAIAGDQIDRAAVDTGGFRFANVAAFDDPDFLPGGAKYGDLPGMLALSAPNPVWIAGEGKTLPPVVAAAYRAAGQAEKATVYSGDATKAEAEAVEWLLK
jgi:dienelactone hydrolase